MPSSNIVLHLAQKIPSHVNHLLFFDNWFTSLPLINHLASREIWCCGTVRAARLPGVPKGKEHDKALEKKGRGSFEELVSKQSNCEVSYLRWYDKRIVNIASNFARVSPVSFIQRYDSKLKKEVDVARPDIIKRYNQSMGGVDLADCLIAFYRISLRSKKYYMQLVFHMLDMAITNSWLLYKRDAAKLNLPKKEVLALLPFKLSVANALAKKGKVQINKRGRPSSEGQTSTAKRARSAPEDIIRFDQIGHFPATETNRNRCKNANCSGKTKFICKKCKVNLCITLTSNCFSLYHGE